MTKRSWQVWRRRLDKFFTLRRRLALEMAGLLVVLGLGLTLYLNTMTTIRVPQAISKVITVELVPTPHPPAESLPPADSLPSPSTIEVPSALEQVQETAIREVRTISLIGVGAFAVLGALGAYWMAKQALRPVQHLSRLVREIRTETLDQRLALDGPPDEVQELADAFDQMLERLERSFKQQSRFVADAAHELRTPLASLRTNLEVVLSDPHAALADYRETASALEQALGRLERLVEDLLLLARGEKDIRVEPVYLEVLISDVIQELRTLAQSHQVSLRYDIIDEVMLQADAPLLARAVSNLIENGIRYNHPGGSVTVTVHREANGVAVSVEDTGVGIPPEEKSHIFERFYRVDRSRARNQGGAGLGLSITAHIVQLHGGHIGVESTPGVGSTFTLWLPCSKGQFPEDQN